MESLKPIHEIMNPDPRSESYVKVNRETNERRPITIDDPYERVSDIRLKGDVPEDIRSYFETVKNVYLYGWFVYSFYTVAMFLSYSAIEMALREKFKQDDPRRNWKFRRLIQEATKRGLIKEDGFPSVKAQREWDKEVASGQDVPFGQPVTDYCAMLAETVPYLRNSFAHPKMDAIVLPAYSISALIFASEFINQLFKAPSDNIAGGQCANE